MSQIILHVGLPKCGSTLVQQVVLPAMFSHVLLRPDNDKSGDNFASTLSRLHQLARLGDPVVYSDESLLFQFRSRVVNRRRLNLLLAQFDFAEVIILVTVRDAERLIRSAINFCDSKGGIFDKLMSETEASAMVFNLFDAVQYLLRLSERYKVVAVDLTGNKSNYEMQRLMERALANLGVGSRAVCKFPAKEIELVNVGPQNRLCFFALRLEKTFRPLVSAICGVWGVEYNKILVRDKLGNLLNACFWSSYPRRFDFDSRDRQRLIEINAMIDRLKRK